MRVADRREGPPGRRAGATGRPATSVVAEHHPVVGALSLRFNRMDTVADHGLTLFTYAAEPGSRSEDALKLLGSWAATADAAEVEHTTDQS